MSGGLTGWITAISSAVTAISSVIQNFQLMKMETTLNEIEHSTRYSMMYLGERKDGGILGVLFKVQENTQFLQGQLDVISGKLGPMADVLTRIETPIDAAAQLLGDILGVERDGMVAHQTALDGILTAITVNSALLDRIAVGQDRQMQVSVTGSDPDAVAAKLAAKMRLQGAF